MKKLMSLFLTILFLAVFAAGANARVGPVDNDPVICVLSENSPEMALSADYGTQKEVVVTTEKAMFSEQFNPVLLIQKKKAETNYIYISIFALVTVAVIFFRPSKKRLFLYLISNGNKINRFVYRREDPHICYSF